MGSKSYVLEDGFEPKSTIYFTKNSFSFQNWNGVQFVEGVVSKGSSGGIFIGVGESILVKYVVNRLNLLSKIIERSVYYS